MVTYRPRLLSPLARDLAAGLGLVVLVGVTMWIFGHMADLCTKLGACA